MADHNKHYTSTARNTQKGAIAKALAVIALTNPILKIDHITTLLGVNHNLVAYYQNQLKKKGDEK